MIATFAPVNHRTRADDCYDQLKTSILRLDLAPGAMLDEVEIAAQIGVSKTPVREALARLAGEGFVVLPPGRRSQVADLTIETISEIYRVRMLLESASLRELTPHLTDTDFAELQQLVDRTAETLDRDELSGFVAASEGFHLLLIGRTGNRCLEVIARRLFDQADRVRAAIFRAEQQATQHTLSRRGVQNHQAVLDALVAGDADRAAALMRADIAMFLDAASTPEMQAAFRRLGQSKQSGPRAVIT